MSELSDMQHWLAEALRQRRAIPNDSAAAQRARRYATGNAWLSPAEQVEIYREQFWLRHTSALVEDFPGLGGVIGQRDWERLVEGYLVTHAPLSWTLRDLGDRFAEYVEREARWLPHHRLCVDMAKLEWAYVEVFDAADEPALDAEKLRRIAPEAWETARVRVSGALRLLRVEYPVGELRRRLRDVRNQGSTETRVEVPERAPQALVVYRGHDKNLFYRCLTPVAFSVLEALRHGTPLVAACELAVQHHDEDPGLVQGLVGEWFADWARRGWLIDVEVEVDGAV